MFIVALFTTAKMSMSSPSRLINSIMAHSSWVGYFSPIKNDGFLLGKEEKESWLSKNQVVTMMDEHGEIISL